MRRGRSRTVRPSPRPRCCRSPSASAPRRRSSASCTRWSSTLSVSQPRHARRPGGGGPGRAQQLVDLHHRRVRRARGAGDRLRRRDRVHDQRRLDDRRRRAGTAARQLRLDEHLRRHGGARPARPDARGRRCAGRRAAGRGPRLSVLAAAVRRRSHGGRPDAAPGGRAARGHRRDAAAVHVARRRRLPADAVSSAASSSPAFARFTSWAASARAGRPRPRRPCAPSRPTSRLARPSASRRRSAWRSPRSVRRSPAAWARPWACCSARSGCCS